MSHPITASTALASRFAPPDPLHPSGIALVLDEEDQDLPAALRSLRDRQILVIGVAATTAALPSSVRAGCDIIVGPTDSREPSAVCVSDPDEEAERILRLVAGHPHASAVLSDVLRMSEHLPPIDALHAESLAYSTLLAGAEFAHWLAARGASRGDDGDLPSVRIERDGARLSLTLNRPERRNAYSARMRDELVAALTVAEADSSVTEILLAGDGPSFCAGGDLAEFGRNTDGVQTHLLRTRGGAAAPLIRLAPRVRAVVHGHCIGAGIEVPAFAGRVQADPETLFRLPEVAMGLIPGAGGTVSITRRIGRHRACWMAVTGDAVTAPLALRWGLVDEISSR